MPVQALAVGIPWALCSLRRFFTKQAVTPERFDPMLVGGLGLIE